MQSRQNKEYSIVNLQTYRNDVRIQYKHHYDINDQAHMIDHADSVVDLSLRIDKTLNLKLDKRIIVLTGYLHDIMTNTDRATHHELVRDYILNRSDKFLKELTEAELNTVAQACYQHRGSYEGEFYSKYSEVISSADRGLPDLKSHILRSYKYHSSVGFIKATDNVHKHLHDKFSTKGYAMYPEMYTKVFKDELRKFKQQIDNLTLEDVRRIVKDN